MSEYVLAVGNNDHLNQPLMGNDQISTLPTQVRNDFINNNFFTSIDRSEDLINAVKQGSFNTVAQLISIGVNINTRDSNTFTVLMIAIEEEHFNIAELLIDNGADLEFRNCYGETALTIAAIRDHFEVVRLLIEKGASIHVQDNHKKTILLDAVSHSNLNIVKLLLEKEADVNKADDEGNTPLLEAVSNSNLNIVKLLLEKGADVNKANDEGKTPLTAAALEAYDLNILKLLLEKGADVNHPANYKNFWIAIEQGEFAAAQALLNAGSDLVLHIEKKGLSGLNVFRNKFNKFFNNEFDGLNAAGKLELLRVFNFMQGNYELFSKLYTKEEILDKKTSIEATQPLKELIDSSIHDIKNTYDADKKTEKLVKFKGLLSKYKDLVDNVSADSMEMKEFITQALELNIDLWQTIKAYMPQDNLKRKAPEPAENGKTELIDLPSKLQKVDLNDAVNEDSLDYENNHFDDFDSNMHNIEELGSMFDPM